MNIKSKEYFPPKSNSVYIYRGFSNSLINFKTSIDYFSENKLQVRLDNGITSAINVYEYVDDGIKLSFQSENTCYHQNLLNENNYINNYLIKEPIIKDNMWFLSNRSKRCITNIDIEVKTQFNLFPSAIEIVTISKNNREFSVDYYVLGIGLVKSIYYTKKTGTLYFELEDILENSSYSKNIKVYYPDKNLNSIWFSPRTLNYYTNEDISLGFSKLFETPPSGLLPLINRNIKIKNMYYNLKNNFAYIDLSEKIIDYLNNNNSLKASLFFECIYYTLRDYYKTNNISITINNEPYTKYFKSIVPTDEFKAIQWRIQDCKFPFTYVVEKDDTLISISKKFDIPYDKIAKLNNIKNPNKLSKNQILQIYSSGVYTIKENDSLESISKSFGLNINKLIQINNITDLSFVSPGKKIKLY